MPDIRTLSNIDPRHLLWRLMESCSKCNAAFRENVALLNLAEGEGLTTEQAGEILVNIYPAHQEH